MSEENKQKGYVRRNLTNLPSWRVENKSVGVRHQNPGGQVRKHRILNLHPTLRSTGRSRGQVHGQPDHRYPSGQMVRLVEDSRPGSFVPVWKEHKS